MGWSIVAVLQVAEDYRGEKISYYRPGIDASELSQQSMVVDVNCREKKTEKTLTLEKCGMAECLHMGLID